MVAYMLDVIGLARGCAKPDLANAVHGCVKCAGKQLVVARKSYGITEAWALKKGEAFIRGVWFCF